jgi:hypothetical protein
VPVVPQQVRYTGTLVNRTGDTVEAVFRIYALPEGGEPLWSETQQVTVGADGSYAILLGAATPGGLPQAVFSGGEARWLGVSVERAPELERVLLASVPYAMKSGDAESLAGRTAADFVTQEQFAALAQQTAAQAALPQTITAAPTGSGAANTVPLWTSASNLGDSKIVQGTAGIGINVSSPASMLDVGGGTTLRGTVNLPAIAVASATNTASNSQWLELGTSVWSASANAPVSETFAWRAEVDSNLNSNLALLYGQGATTPASTGLSISPSGVINFSPSQTFPIKGTGGGTITGIKTASPLTGSGTSGSVSLGLNQAALVSDIAPAIATAIAPTLEGTYNGVYAQLGAQNTFTQGQTIEGETHVYGSVPWAPILQAINTSSAGFGVVGYGTQSAHSIGVFGSLDTATNSNSFNLLWGTDGLSASMWADAPNGQEAAMIATGDDVYGAILYNASATLPTISLNNNYSGGGPTGAAVAQGIGTVLRAAGPGGVCAINQTGNLACTGQMKALVATAGGARQVETYTVQSAENWVEDYGSDHYTGPGVRRHRQHQRRFPRLSHPRRRLQGALCKP